MQRKPADVINDANMYGPGAVFLVDGNNNLVVPVGSGGSSSDVVTTGNLTTASGGGSTVQLQLGTGQATWEAQLTGTFSSGTTIAFQGSDDASSPTNWQSAVGYNSALTNPIFITQIGGPGPFIIRGPAAGYQYIQMVCTALHAGDNVAVRLIGSTGAMAGGGPVNIPDGSNIVEGTTTDANTVNSMMGRLTKIRDLLNAALTVSGTVTANIDATNSTHLANIDTATSDLVADLDTLITNTGRIPSSPATEGGHLATIDSVQGATNDAAVLGDVNGTLSAKLRGLSKILNALTDTFGNSTAISAATTLAAIPTTAGLVTNSFATLSNASYQDTFIVQVNVASAFIGTIGFYGLLPDGSTLQQINAHQRGTTTTTNATAINTGAALEQTWQGSIAGFKALYVICSAFTSGAASVQLGLTAANYAHAIINTVSQNLTLLNGTAPQLDGGSSNRLGVSLYGKSSAAGDTPLGLDASGRITAILQAVAGTALAADQSNTILRISNYGKNAAAGDTPFLLDSSGRLINISTIEDAIRNGKGYQATTGKIATATNPNLVGGMGLYNASGSGKSILIYSIKFYLSAASTVNQVNLTTADPAMGSAITPVNLKPGGSASVATVSAPANNFTASVSVIGTLLDTIYALSSTPIEVLTNGACILLPSGANNGVATYLTIATAAQSFAVAMKWLEF